MLLPLLGLIAGVLVGLAFSVSIPSEFARYTAMAMLAALDSLLGAARAELQGEYDNKIFVSGLVTNMLLASFLTYVGDRLGVQLNVAAIVAFGVRVFNNLGHIRRMLISGTSRPKSPSTRPQERTDEQ